MQTLSARNLRKVSKEFFYRHSGKWKAEIIKFLSIFDKFISIQSIINFSGNDLNSIDNGKLIKKYISTDNNLLSY